MYTSQLRVASLDGQRLEMRNSGLKEKNFTFTFRKKRDFTICITKQMDWSAAYLLCSSSAFFRISKRQVFNDV